MLSFLLGVLAVGCAVLWIGIPIACLWAAGEITDERSQRLLIVLPSVLVSMVLWGKGLFWVNRLYVRIRMGVAAVEPDPDADEWDEPRWIRGPLEPMLVATLFVALAALFVWFFVFAKNPSSQVL